MPPIRAANDYMKLEAAGHVDCATLLPVEASSLPRGLHARCIAFHPRKPLLAVGVQTCVGGYDLVSGVRLGRVDIRTPPVALMFSRDGSLLVVATQEWNIIGINTSNWRSRVLAPFTEARNAPLDNILMAITGGSRPVVFFTRYGKNSIRMAVNTGDGAAKKASSDKKLKWGVKLKLDVNKAVVGLAAHPTASQLLLLFDDASLRGYAMTPTGLQPLWPSVFTMPGDAATLARLSVSPPLFQTLAHPSIDGACLLAIGSGGGGLLVLEIVGRAEPRVVLKSVTEGNQPIIGMGVHQPQRVLFVFATKPGTSNLQVLCWQMYNTPVPHGSPRTTSGLAFEQIAVDADSVDASQATIQGTNTGGGSKTLQAAAAAAGTPGSAAAAAAGGGVEWQGLWGVEVNEGVLENAAAGSFLLNKLLAPVIQSAVIHPTLGCVAVQRAPPLALREARNIMMQRLGLISAPEAAISRRTAAVPLLRLLHSSQPGAMWPGGRVAPLHTGLHFWQTAAGMGLAKLQFPCHLYYLSPGRLCKYSLAAKRSGVFADLSGTGAAASADSPKAAAAAAAGRMREARQLVHSAKQHAWLVFFEVLGLPAAGAGSGSDSSSGSRRDSWQWTLVTDAAAAAAGQGQWFLPGANGVFLGPQDLFFAVAPIGSNTISVYRTPGFNGNSLALYTVSLAKPSSLGCGLFPGPSALAAPKIGAEAAARAAREAAEAADKAALEAAAAAEAGEGGGEAGAAAAADATAAVPAPVSESTGRHIRRPGETWRPSEDDGGDDGSGGGSMIPVLGVGAGCLQHAGQGARGKHHHHDDHDHHQQQDQEPGKVHSGGGVVMWQGAGGKLLMGGLPAPGVQYAAGEDSDDPDAAAPAAGAAIAPDMGKVIAEHSLQLQVAERLLHVAWQNTSQNTPLEPHQCAAAVLTTQRLLLVSGDLTLLAGIPASCGSVGLSNAITSLLWVGPALLFMTAAGQVMQLTWTGQTQHMASVAAEPPALLAGALADSLLLVRQNPATGQDEVTSRAVGLLQPLVLGWTSLASCGLLPKGLNTARAALQALLEAFDATHVTSGMLWSLIQAWCGDVAAALAAHAADVEPSVQLAANAAAGKWAAVVSTLRSEHQHSVFYPKPAAAGSQLHHKLLAAAAGAVMHGQFKEAQQCLEAAGEWETAMALAVCCGDFASLRSLASGLQSAVATAAGGQAETADISRLARGLIAAYERNGRAFGIVGGGQPSDWKLRAVMADNSFFSNATDWTFGGTGKLPAMETSSFNAPASFVQESEVGPVPRADSSTLGAYLGYSDLVQTGTAAGQAGAGVLPGAGASSDADFLANLDQLVALSSKSSGPDSKTGLVRSGSAASSASSDTGLEGALSGTAAQQRERDPFSFSDDEDDDGTSFGYKFRIHIREADNPAAAGATGGAPTADLKSAAQKLKLGPPGSAGSFKEAFSKGGKRQDSLRSSTSLEESPSGGPDSLYDLSFLAGAVKQPAATSPAAAGLSSAGPSAASSSSGLSRPPKAPGASSSTGAGSFDALGSMMGIRSSGSTPGLGGPAMRPKSQSQASTAPVISDDDFFAALAPAIPDAAKSKLLSAPPPPPGAAAAAAAAGAAAGAGRLAPPPPPGAAAPGAPAVPARPAPASAAPAAASPGDSTALYLKGVSEMESANWDGAIDSFSCTLAALTSDPSGPSKVQRQSFAAQYLAAVLLLKAAGSGSTPREARLYRFAAALRLDDRHTLSLVKEAVLRNKFVGNYKYAADQLTWLVTRSLGSAPMEFMARLQEDIDECDRKGGRDASVPGDERLDEWVGLVAAGTSRQDVDEVVQPLLAAP